MTNDQITRELVKDYRKLRQTQIQGLMKAYDWERKRKNIPAGVAWPKQYIVKVPMLANEWMVVLQKPPGKAEYEGSQDVVGYAVAWYNCAEGIRVFRPTETLIEVFNAHFFRRYNERMQLNLHDLEDVMECFFLNSGYFQPDKVKEGKDRYVMSVCRGGAALGKYQYGAPLRWLVHNTFITHRQMRKSQASERLELLMNTHESFIQPASRVAKKNPAPSIVRGNVDWFALAQAGVKQLLARA